VLTGHNNFIRHLHIMGLNKNPTSRKSDTEEESSVHILNECEVLASPRHMYVDSFFLDPEDIKMLRVGAIWYFAKEIGLL